MSNDKIREIAREMRKVGETYHGAPNTVSGLSRAVRSWATRLESIADHDPIHCTDCGELLTGERNTLCMDCWPVETSAAPADQGAGEVWAVLGGAPSQVFLDVDTAREITGQSEFYSIPVHGAPTPPKQETPILQCATCHGDLAYAVNGTGDRYIVTSCERCAPAKEVGVVGLVSQVNAYRDALADTERKLGAMRRCRDEHIDRADKYKARAEAAERERDELRERVGELVDESLPETDDFGRPVKPPSPEPEAQETEMDRRAREFAKAAGIPDPTEAKEQRQVAPSDALDKAVKHVEKAYAQTGQDCAINHAVDWLAVAVAALQKQVGDAETRISAHRGIVARRKDDWNKRLDALRDEVIRAILEAALASDDNGADDTDGEE